MKVYQVINSSGNPASNDFNENCTFPKIEEAENFIEYLHEECNVKGKFSIKDLYLVSSDLFKEFQNVLHMAYDWLPDELDQGLIKSLKDDLKKANDTLRKESK